MAATRTLRNLLETALQNIGKYDPGITPSAEDIQVCLRTFQDMMEEFASDELFLPYLRWENFNLVAATRSYTIGENGTPSLNVIRPEQILSCYILDSGNNVHWLNEISEENYKQIESSAGRPERYWYNPTAPNGTLYVDRAPQTVEAIYVSFQAGFDETSALTTNLLNTLEIPRNYHGPMAWCLALDLAPKFGVDPSSFLERRAAQAMNRILSLNAARTTVETRTELSGMSKPRRYNINLG